MYLIKNGKAAATLWIKRGCAEAIANAAKEISQSIGKICGEEMPVCVFDDPKEITGIAIALVEKKDNFSVKADGFLKKLDGTDGFCVVRDGDVIVISSPASAGVYFGAHGFLEENADIIWSRGRKGFDCLFSEQKEIFVRKVDYFEKPCFSVRGWHACGCIDGVSHYDPDTVLFHSRNKLNTKFEGIDRSDIGVRPLSVGIEQNNLDCLVKEHPEYFMTAVNGVGPRLAAYESFFNWYNLDAAREIGKRIAAARKAGDIAYDTVRFIMPDSSYFYVEQDGKLLHETPFVSSNGETVYPDDPAYKSTVYFTFMNELTRTVADEIPDMKICTFAYIYSECCPKIEKLHKNLIVMIASIEADMHYAYAENNSESGRAHYENLCRWSKLCKNLVAYDYTGTLNIGAYSRPIAKVVQSNYRLYRKLGFLGVIPEALIDNPLNAESRNVYEMNELYFWLVCRLMWDPDIDLNAATDKFCRLAYGKAAPYMRKYYDTIQKGWDNGKGLVRYSTGGDVYIRQLIIDENLHGDVLENLSLALGCAESETRRARIVPIYETMQKAIAIYLKCKSEDVTAMYCGAGKETILSDEQLDYKNNSNSVWNSAKSLRVLQNYDTMEDYPTEAGFEAKILWDEKYIYFGFGVRDDALVDPHGKNYDSTGARIAYRENGEKIQSYVETYICGDENNRSVVYGYITGLFPDRGDNFWVNTGSPSAIDKPPHYRGADFIHYDENPLKRYYFSVQAIAFEDLDTVCANAVPCLSFVYFNDRYGRAGWKGNGLWSKEKMQRIAMLRTKS